MNDLIESLSELSKLKFKDFKLEGNPPPWERSSSIADIEATEVAVGCRFPDSLRTLYQKVSNGGFGPGFGMMSMSNEFYSDSDDDIFIEAFYKFASDHDDIESGAIWPSQIVAIIDLGCGMKWCLDCESDEIVYFAGDSIDEGDVESFKDAFVQTGVCFEQGMRDWCNGIKWENYLPNNTCHTTSYKAL